MLLPSSAVCLGAVVLACLCTRSVRAFDSSTLRLWQPVNSAAISCTARQHVTMLHKPLQNASKQQNGACNRSGVAAHATSGRCHGVSQQQHLLQQRQQSAQPQQHSNSSTAVPVPRVSSRTTLRSSSRSLVPRAAAVASPPTRKGLRSRSPSPQPTTSKSPTEPDSIPRGETAGAVMILEDVTLQAGERDLLEDSSWRMMPGHRVGLVGANGAGKSTLLKAIAGLRGIDTGTLRISNNVAVGYLAQTAVSGSTKTVYEEAKGAMTALAAAEAALEAAGAAAEAGDPEAAQMLADSQEAYEAAGGYDADRRIGVVLDGLGFRREQWDWGCDRFSGGWQMRIALAKMLLSPAGQAASSSNGGEAGGGMLLLDEPTNHLDAAAVKWLAGFLANSGGSLILVSHDEALLQGACDRITEVRGKRLHHYVGNYNTFLQQREERAAMAAATAASKQAEIARLEDFVTRFGAKASKASEAQSKLKLLEKLKKEAAAVTDPSLTAAASDKGPGDARKVSLRLPSPPPCFSDVLMVKDLAVGWGSPAAAAAAAEPAAAAAAAGPVLSEVTLTVRKGQRVLVLGPNGAGKSTLLKTLAGRIEPWSGSVKQGEGVKLAVFDQDLAQELPLDQTALDYVSDVARRNDPNVTLEKVRAALGALGLTGSLPLQTIGSLSGGEKARVALAVFALVPANVLLLDEASNHLDAATLEVLTGALQGFNGAIVAITHNPAFAAALNPTHILRVAGGTAKLSEHRGILSPRDFDHRPSSSSSSSKAAAGSSSSNGKAAGGSSNGKAAAGSSSSSKAAATPSKKGNAPAKSRGSTSSNSGSSGSSTPAATSSSSSSSKPARKRTTLAFKERLRYEELCKQLEGLQAKRQALEAQVTTVAQSGDVSALEAASQQLAQVADQADAAELEWLELAELAGDL